MFAMRPASGAPELTLAQVLAARIAAIQALHLKHGQNLETMGALSGSGLLGRFHTWRAGADEREDESIGVRASSTFAIGKTIYEVNPSGDVRTIDGLLLRRETTGNFIDDGDFTAKPQFDRFLGPSTLPDGRAVYGIEVSPPGGQPETVYLDAKTWLIDRIAYAQDDGISTQDYYAYRVVQGVLLALREVESNGDHPFDITRVIRSVRIGDPIDAAVFTLPASSVIQTAAPVTVQLTQNLGHLYVPVQIQGHTYRFLLDSGAQVVVLDTQVARQLGLQTEGNMEVSGATRTGGLGEARLDSVQVGGATLPVRVVSVLNLRTLKGSIPIDGILGFPFFAAAEVRIDPAKMTMTIAKPGTLPVLGTMLPVDTDRQFVEVHATINGYAGRFVVDTGDNNELLVYNRFAQSHPGTVPVGDQRYASDYGVGGAAKAYSTAIKEFDLGQYRLYYRRAGVMLATQGAFADRFDAGNIGTGILRNFIVTFDVANQKLYVTPSSLYDDRHDYDLYQRQFP